MSNHNRKFDWDIAKRLRDEGMTYNDIAKQLGVTKMAVVYAVDDDLRRKQRAYHSEWQKASKRWVGTCIDCGDPATRTRGYGSRHGRCRACAAKTLTTTVREDTLRCSCCGLWLPDEEFHNQAQRKHRRGRHGICRPCSAVMKRDWRQANPDLSRAYERARYQRRKAAS